MFNNEEFLRHIPKSLIVCESIKERISAGRYGKTGSNFLSVRELTKEMGVSLVTAHRIMKILKDDGFLILIGKRYAVSIPKKSSGTRANIFSAKKKKIIGLVVTNLDNPFFSMLAKQAELAALNAGMKIIIAGSNYDLKKESDILNMFIHAGVSGILSCPGVHPDTYKLYSALVVPFVFMARSPENIEGDTVMVHQFNAAEKIAKHFINLGFSNYAYIGIEELQQDTRLQGFTYGLQESGRKLSAENVILVSNKDAGLISSRINQFVKKIPSRTAIFCFHDLLAAQVIKACHRADIRIPTQIAVAGFDNLPVASQIYPALTTIGYPLQEMAEVAVDRLLKKTVMNKPGKSLVHYLDTELIIRGSTAEEMLSAAEDFSIIEPEYKVS